MSSRGFSLVELLVVMAIVGILGTIGYVNYVKSLNPVQDATGQIVTELARARADAMANTQATRLVLESANTIRVETATNCNKSENDATASPPVQNWSTARTLNWPDLNRENTVQLVTATPTATPNIIACYTSRGMADQSRTFNVRDGTRDFTIQIALGGGVDYYATPQ